MPPPLPPPFGPDSRTGVELEYIAPDGKSRRDLAEALVRRFGGSLDYGFKYFSDGRYDDGRPVCHLTPAYRVFDEHGEPLFTIVDDNTIKDDLDPEKDSASGLYRVLFDDLRFAIWAERNCWAAGQAPEVALGPLLETFAGSIGEKGKEGAQHPEHQIVQDLYGHAIAVVALYGSERHRVTEVVTRPLSREERMKVVEGAMAAAAEEGFELPHEAALHFHFDRRPWMSTPRLQALILRFQEERSSLWERFQPNPACRQLGPMASKINVCASVTSPKEPFDEFCKALDAVGVSKHVDLNILGVVKKKPRQPTIEFRCLPMTKSVKEFESMLAETEAFLTRAAASAD